MKSTGFPPHIIELIDARAENLCEGCGHNWIHEHHHRAPRGAGGTSNPMRNWPSNCLALCRDCHRMAESYRNVAKVLGWIIPKSVDHSATEPVLRRGVWVWLSDDGTYTVVKAAS